MHRQGMYAAVSWNYLAAWRRIFDSLIHDWVSQIYAFMEFRGYIP